VSTHLHSFSDQAARFATRPDDHARLQANIDRRVADLGREYAHRAVDQLVAGDPDGAYQLMLECLTRQLAEKKIKTLVVVS
jgi:hypothetical protein